MKKVVILGGGITGLVSAYYLSKFFKVTLLEKEKILGGAATSFEHKDFTLDLGPHKLYSEIPGIINEIKKVCPLIKIKKKNSIFLKNTYFDFPLKLSQIGLKMPFTAFKAGLDILTKPFYRLPDDSYENFLLNRFGKTLYNLSFRDYALKVWNSNPKELDMELAKRRVAISGIFQLIKSVLFKDTKKISAEFFYYPKSGMVELIDKLAKAIKKNGGRIITKSNISEIKIINNKISYIKTKNKKLKTDYMISTIPLDSLLKITKIHTPLIKDLSYQDLNIIYFILKKPKALNDCWVFFPEKEFIFQRVSEQKAFSPYTSPKDKTAVMVETTKNLDKKIIEKIIAQLKTAKILEKKDIEEYFIKTIKKAYPLYKKGFSKSFKIIENDLESTQGFYLLGRQGLFNYNNMDQCWDMGIRVADHIIKKKSNSDWNQTKAYFDKYRIVD